MLHSMQTGDLEGRSSVRLADSYTSVCVYADAKLLAVQMIGFLTAIIIEAATGRGILVQLIGYAKALNLLGPASGVDL